jgi:hypothetical protein
VLFFNASSYIIGQFTITELTINVLPILILIILTIVFKSKYITATVFLILAIGTSLDPANITDYSGSIFFIYSFHLIRKKEYAWAIIILTIACVTTRSIIAGDTVPEAFILLSIFFYIYAIYYFLIYKDCIKPVRIRFKELSKQETKLLKLMAEGHSQKTAGAQIGLSISQTSELVKNIRIKLGYDSVMQILYLSGVNNSPINKSTK